MAHGQGGAEVTEDGSGPTLTCNHEAPILAFDCKASGRNGFGIGDVAPTLRAMGHANSHGNGGGQVAVVEPYTLALRGREGTPQLEVRQGGTANTILTPNGGRGGIGVGAIANGMAVRRLTPRECERLQGFPDDYTLIATTMVTHRKACALYGTKEVVPHGTIRLECGCKAKHKRAEVCPDGPRYKALGNSMAVPVMRWIGKRIEAVERVAANGSTPAAANDNNKQQTKKRAGV